MVTEHHGSFDGLPMSPGRRLSNSSSRNNHIDVPGICQPVLHRSCCILAIARTLRSLMPNRSATSLTVSSEKRAYDWPSLNAIWAIVIRAPRILTLFPYSPNRATISWSIFDSIRLQHSVLFTHFLHLIIVLMAIAHISPSSSNPRNTIFSATHRTFCSRIWFRGIGLKLVSTYVFAEGKITRCVKRLRNGEASSLMCQYPVAINQLQISLPYADRIEAMYASTRIAVQHFSPPDRNYTTLGIVCQGGKGGNYGT